MSRSAAGSAGRGRRAAGLPAAVAAALCLVGVRWLWIRSATTRVRSFRRISAEPLVMIPGESVGADEFKTLYRHPAAQQRRTGASLSGLHFYWLAPSARIHQENLENGPEYTRIASATRHILAVPPASARQAAGRLTGEALDRLPAHQAVAVRVRDLMTPVWAEFFYELVFREPCPAAVRALITANSDNLLGTIKHISPRNLRVRHRLADALSDRLTNGNPVPAFPASLSVHRQALYLQGVVFGTGVAQMSEAVAHLCMNLATRRSLQHDIAADTDGDRLLDMALQESLRLNPLFGIAHRIASTDIETPGTRIRRGSVLCFDFTAYQRQGFDRPDEFLPERWQHLSEHNTNQAPFGVQGNRPCPARSLALTTAKAAVSEILHRYELQTTARHTRPLHNRGPCILIPRAATAPSGRSSSAPLRLRMRLRDGMDETYYRAAQLAVGAWTVRRARLAARPAPGIQDTRTQPQPSRPAP